MERLSKSLALRWPMSLFSFRSNHGSFTTPSGNKEKHLYHSTKGTTGLSITADPNRYCCTLSSTAVVFSLALCNPAYAQQETDLAEVNNGTNPTLLTTQAGVQYQYNEINSDLNTGLFEAFLTIPLGADRSKALRVTVPGSDSPFNSRPRLGGAAGAAAADDRVGDEFVLGDISLMFIDVFYLTEESGSAYTFELFTDTANSDYAGYGQFAGEATVYYAWFLENGNIFAPAWVQTFGLEGGNDADVDVNVSTVDFYYVPKLANPRFFMTYDPAIIHDWESDNTFGSLQVTFGMMTGRLLGGDSQVILKPGILMGGDRPGEWSVQLGFKILNF